MERDTYKQSRQGLDEMYNEAQRQLKEECQLRQVRLGLRACVRAIGINKSWISASEMVTCTFLYTLVVLFLGCGE